MVYRITSMDGAGERSETLREAENREALVAAVRADGGIVIAVEEASSAAGERANAKKAPMSPRRFFAISRFEIEMGLRQLASMVKSGVTLLSALETVAEQSAGAAAKVWSDVASRILAGETLSAAFAAQGRRFGEITIRLAEMGEKSGELEKALARAADHLESRRLLRSTVVNALAYPFIALAMAVGVSCYLVVGVIPKLAEFLRAGGENLPALTQMLMDFSDWMIANSLTVLAGVAAVAALWIFLRFIPPTRELEDAFLMRLPVTGRILRLSGTALFARSMQIMTESGITLVDALSTAAALLSNRRLRRRVEKARGDVLKGGALSSSLKEAKEFMPMLSRMTAVGEMTGALPEIFGETARFHEMLLAVAVKRFGMMIEPVMIVITGGIVGFVYIAFFMALFAIAGTN